MSETEHDSDSGSDDDHDLDGTDEYEQMLEQLDVAIGEVNHKIEDGRVRSPEHDQVRIKYYRALGYLIRSRLKVIEQRDLQELEARLEELERVHESTQRVGVGYP